MHLNQPMPGRGIRRGEWIVCCVLASQLPGLQMLRRGSLVRALKGQNHSWRVTTMALSPSSGGSACFSTSSSLWVFGLFFSLLGPDPAPSDISVFKPKNPTCLRERVYVTQLGSGTCPGGYWTTGYICVIWKRHHFSRQM